MRECGGATGGAKDGTGREYGGLDLSSTTDISALVLVFPEPDGSVIVLAWFWIPKDRMEERSKRDGVPYVQWCSQGLIEATEGNVIDYAFIRAKINDLAEQYTIKQINYDPYNATQLVVELTGDGLPMTPLRQGFPSLSAPSKEVERLVMAGKLHHGGNKVLDWMANNVCVLGDAAGNVKPHKTRSKERIDGISGLVNAMDGKMRHDARPKEYRVTFI